MKFKKKKNPFWLLGCASSDEFAKMFILSTVFKVHNHYTTDLVVSLFSVVTIVSIKFFFRVQISHSAQIGRGVQA